MIAFFSYVFTEAFVFISIPFLCFASSNQKTMAKNWNANFDTLFIYTQITVPIYLAKMYVIHVVRSCFIDQFSTLELYLFIHVEKTISTR